jgi:hypothetical protein
MKEQRYTVKNAVPSKNLGIVRIKLFLAKNTAALVGGYPVSQAEDSRKSWNSRSIPVTSQIPGW